MTIRKGSNIIAGTSQGDLNNKANTSLDNLDTAGQAILDAKANDTNTLHKTGNEEYNGVKTYVGTSTGNYKAVKGTFMFKGTSGSNKYLREVFLNGDDVPLGYIGSFLTRGGDSGVEIAADSSYLTIYNDNLFGEVKGVHTNTPALDSNDTRIATTEWVNNIGNNIVHKTGDETIDGGKTFAKSLIINSNETNSSLINIINQNLIKGTIPSQNYYTGILCGDNTGTGDTGRISSYSVRVDTNGTVRAALQANKFQVNSTSGAEIAVYYPQAGNPYAEAPAPIEDTTSSRQIDTVGARNTKLANYLPLSGGTLTGNLTITKNVPNVNLRNTEITKGTAPSATKLTTMNFYDKDGKSLGVVRHQYGTNKNSTVELLVYKANAHTDTESTFLSLTYPATGSSYLKTVEIRPDADNTRNLGISSVRWKQLYAGTTTIATSDERLKQNIETLPDNVLDAWGEVDFYRYKFIDAVKEKGKNEARYHIGMIAQRIEQIFNKHDLNALDYGLLCYDEWEAEEEEKDEDGNIIRPAIEAGNRYSLRYEECLCMEAAYQRRRADRIEERLKALEEKLK